MIEDKELAQLFKAESAEHLARLDDGLLRLEKTPADQSLLEELFRESHSLKGAARMLGLSKIETAAHGLETILNTARKGDTPLTPDVIERMTAVLSDLRRLVAIECGLGVAEQPNADFGFRNAELKTDTKPTPSFDTPQSAISTPQMVGRVSPSWRNPTSNIPAYGNVGLRDEAANPTYIPPQSDIPHSLPAPSAARQAGETPIPHLTEPFRIETVRVETRKLDDLLTLVGELSVIEGRAQHRLSLMDDLLEQWTLLERSSKKGSADCGMHPQGVGRAVPVAEATTATLRNAEFGKKIKQVRDAFFEDGARLETTVNTLEEQVHAARLLPLSTVFALFPRMVRDLARQQDKEVELVIEGDDINVDKRILEEMKDPLMHLLRNAIDHGIEAPDERERQGKPRGGTVRLRARRENSTLMLEVRDDGRGLDLEAIRRTALKRGLHDEATLAAMPIAQLQGMIFLPGFSTSSFVTDLSGRGVGLDVVRVNVEHLKGDIRIESAMHQGMAVQVRLPLSLATTRLLLIRAGAQVYGLPIEFVHTSLRVSAEEIFALEGRPSIKLDGLPLIAPRLTELLALPATDSETVCIVIQAGDERLGIMVEEVLNVEEVVAKPLGTPLTRVRNISSMTILGSGEVCAVLNPADLLRTAHKGVRIAEFGVRSADSIPQSALRNPHSILLVEDSALVRAMEKRILEDAGYEVVAAADGVDGLDALGRHSFAAVVSDIMMPNMDGLTLTARIRKEPRYKDMPVILVTTLSSDEDRRRGLEAGANAYIPKPSFDQRLLLETIKRLI